MAFAVTATPISFAASAEKLRLHAPNYNVPYTILHPSGTSAESSISVLSFHPAGTCNVFRPLQPINAASSILVTLSGIVTLVKPLQF